MERGVLPAPEACVRLGHLKTALDALFHFPRAPVEPTTISHLRDNSNGGADNLGVVYAPDALSAENVRLLHAPLYARRRLGAVDVMLDVLNSPFKQEPSALMSALSIHLLVDVAGLPPEGASDDEPLATTILAGTQSSTSSRLILRVALPTDASHCARVALRCVSLAGTRVAGGPVRLPASVPVVTGGTCPPLVLRPQASEISPSGSLSITASGMICVALARALDPVFVAAADGATLREPAALLSEGFEAPGGRLSSAVAVAASEPLGGLLVLLTTDALPTQWTPRDVFVRSASVLSVRRLADFRPLWRIPCTACSVAVLPGPAPGPDSACDVIVVCATLTKQLKCYASSNGAALSSLTLLGAWPRAVVAAGAGLPGVVVVSTEAPLTDGSVTRRIRCCSWDGTRLHEEGAASWPPAGALDDTGPRECAQLLAAMPPAPGKAASHLLVGTCGSSALLVLSLPDLTLVHKHSFAPWMLMGLAADPTGTALATCVSHAMDAQPPEVHVHTWPLDGMPMLP